MPSAGETKFIHDKDVSYVFMTFELASTAEDIIMVLCVRFDGSAEGCTGKQTASRKVVANPFSADE